MSLPTPWRLRTRIILTISLMVAFALPVLAQTGTSDLVAVATHPFEGMMQAGDGNFYSLSRYGQTCDSNSNQFCSYIYQTTPSGDTSVFHAFPPVPVSGGNTATNTDGYLPVALIFATDGNFYGACEGGGTGGLGTIFKITPAGMFTVLASFGVNGSGVGDPGIQPNSLIQGADGNFYSTNPTGVYEMTPAGAVSTIYTFPPSGMTGISPNGSNATSIMQASDGNFYVTVDTTPGVMSGATGANVGAIVQITSGGQWNLVHSFALDGSEGRLPSGPLVEGSDGYLYGVNESLINTVKTGKAYKVAPSASGAFVLLASFTGPIYFNWDSALFLGSDGNFYGTTLQGGDYTTATCKQLGCGTAYQLTPAGGLTTLYTFEGGTRTSTDISANPQSDTAAPMSPLVQTYDGTFFGGSTNAVFDLSMDSPLPAPVQLTANPATAADGSPVTITWKVLNAFSKTAQQCGATVQGGVAGAGNWSGLQTGTFSGNVYGGTATINPAASGPYTYALTCGGKESGFVTIGLQIETESLLRGTVGKPFEQILSLTGGTPGYTWTVSAAGGALPEGLSFDMDKGVLSGTPLQYGDYTLDFKVEDSTETGAQTATKSLKLIIDSGLKLLPALQPPPGLNKMYNQMLTTTGGLEPYNTYTLTSEALPAGLQLNANTGVISGTATQAGQYTFSISVSDSEGTPAMVTQNYTVNIGDPLQIITPAVLPAAQVGVPYSANLVATGGMPQYTWSPGNNLGILSLQVPPGLTLTSDGTISGTPIQWNAPLSYNFAVNVADSSNPQLSEPGAFSITCNSTLKLVTSSLPSGTVGAHMEVPLAATGGIPPYTFKIGSTPDPATIGLSVSGDMLVYQPLQPITTDVTVYVEDSEKNKAFDNAALPLTIVASLLPTTTMLSSSNAAAGTGESVTFTATVVPTGGSGGGTPTGQVLFYNGGTLLGTTALDATGKATLQTSFASPGAYTITATYGGSSTLATSISAPVTETVVTPAVSGTVSPTTLTIKSGSSGQLVITLTPVGDYSGTVSFSCGTLPSHASCSFVPSSLKITAGSGPVTDGLTVSTNAPLMAMLFNRPDEATGSNMFAASTLWLQCLLAAMLLPFLRKRRGAGLRNFWMPALLCLFLALALSGCGGSTSTSNGNGKTAGGTYTVPITLTVSGGTTQVINATVIVD